MRKLIQRRVDAVRLDLESSPHAAESVIRYNLGQLSALKWVLERFAEASEIVKSL